MYYKCYTKLSDGSCFHREDTFLPTKLSEIPPVLNDYMIDRSLFLAPSSETACVGRFAARNGEDAPRR